MWKETKIKRVQCNENKKGGKCNVIKREKGI